MAVVAVTLAAGCGSKPVVGVLLAKTGTIGTYGEAMGRGIQLALDEAGAAGTMPSGMQVVWADSASDSETAIREFRRLVDEQGARLIIAGVTSGEAGDLLPVIDETNVVCISPSCSLPRLTKESKLFYRLFASDELEARVAARFLYESQDATSVLIYTSGSEQARGIEPPFRQTFELDRGGKVVGKVDLTQPEWEKESADLLAAHDPAAVYVIAYAENTLLALRHIRARGYKGVICVTSAFYSGEAIAQDPELVEGVYFPQPAFDTQDELPLVQDFVKGFRDTFDKEPDIYAAHAYDTMRLVMFVLGKTPVLETSEIRKTLSFGLEEFPGVTGIIQFNDYGDVHHNPIMFIIRDGQVLNHERWLKAEKKRIHEEIKRLLGRR
jgi:branched-chain amino acid transport system substrate-binding protein